jgi:hypothetical protein
MCLRVSNKKYFYASEERRWIRSHKSEVRIRGSSNLQTGTHKKFADLRLRNEPKICGLLKNFCLPNSGNFLLTSTHMSRQAALWAAAGHIRHEVLPLTPATAQKFLQTAMIQNRRNSYKQQ